MSLEQLEQRLKGELRSKDITVTNRYHEDGLSIYDGGYLSLHITFEPHTFKLEGLDPHDEPVKQTFHSIDEVVDWFDNKHWA